MNNEINVEALLGVLKAQLGDKEMTIAMLQVRIAELEAQLRTAVENASP